MKVIAINNQSLFDIANQAFGNVDAAFAFALANGMSLTAEIAPGASIELPGDESLKNVDQSNYFDKKKLATYVGLPIVGDLSPVFGGIGYMGIEIDFIVS